MKSDGTFNDGTAIYSIDEIESLRAQLAERDRRVEELTTALERIHKICNHMGPAVHGGERIATENELLELDNDCDQIYVISEQALNPKQE